MCSHADGAGCKCCIANAIGNAVLNCPCNCLGVVRVCQNIAKGTQLLRLGRTCRTPQEGYDLRSGVGSVRSKQRVAHTAGNALLRRPEDCIVVVILRVHVGEEVEHGVVIHKDCLHHDLARRHGKGVLAAALVGQLERLAVLVQHGQAFEDVALVGGHGDGHGVALGGRLGRYGDGAVLIDAGRDLGVGNGDASAASSSTTAARGRAVRLPVDRHRHIMRGHLEGNTSSCAFRVLCLPLQLLFADSLERQTLQGEAVAFADLKTDLSADRVSCGIILARGNPHDSAVQPMSRDSVLRRDFQCKCCRKILSAVIVVSNLIDIAVYRQDIAADRAALPVAGFCYIKTRRQRVKIKSVVDRSNRICVVLCIQFGQLGIPAEVQTCEVITGTIQIFQLRKIFNTRKISDFHIVDINILHQRNFPCAEFTILIPINIGFFIKKKLSEVLIREVGLVDINIRVASCNRQCENNVLFRVIQFRTGITDVIGIDHDSGIAIYCKSISADCAALPVSGL